MSITQLKLDKSRTDLNAVTGSGGTATVSVASVANYTLWITCRVIGTAVSSGTGSAFTDYSETVITQNNSGQAVFASVNPNLAVDANPQQENSTGQTISGSHAIVSDTAFNSGAPVASTVRWTVSAANAVCTVTNNGVSANDFTVILEIIRVSNQ
jgi:hypothetical protein